jgi:hypothetical protein
MLIEKSKPLKRGSENQGTLPLIDTGDTDRKSKTFNHRGYEGTRREERSGDRVIGGKSHHGMNTDVTN